jgi:hypothetical protein
MRKDFFVSADSTIREMYRAEDAVLECLKDLTDGKVSLNR